jgi:hypothetical protein
MISAFAPLLPAHWSRDAAAGVRSRRAVRAQARNGQSLGWCVLLFALLLQGAVAFAPQALLVSPLQSTPGLKMASGYAMVALMVFAMVFGSMRRLPAMALHLRKLHEWHQLAGLVLLVLLAFHMGQRPAGFLLGTFHAMAVGVACGALRTLVGTRVGRRGSTVLLAAHICASCLVSAAALLHLYFVYAYTA